MTSTVPTLAGSTIEPNEKASSRSPSPAGVVPPTKEFEGVGSDHSEGGEDETQYPGPVALALISLALCLAVFLVALVSDIRGRCLCGRHECLSVLLCYRTKPSSRLRSQRSRTNSKLWRMWDGMAVLIC